MRLKSSALLAIIGIVYLFLSRVAATFWPHLFYPIPVADLNILLSLLATGTLLLFYLLFYGQFTLPGKKGELIKNERLGRAALFAASGSIFLMLHIALGAFRIVGMDTVLSMETQTTTSVYFLLAASICFVYFAGVFYEESLKKVSGRLSSAAKLTVWGASIGLLLRIYLMLRLYYPSQFRWNGALNSGPLLLLIPMILFVFFTAIYFFWVFYRES